VRTVARWAPPPPASLSSYRPLCRGEGGSSQPRGVIAPPVGRGHHHHHHRSSRSQQPPQKPTNQAREQEQNATDRPRRELILIGRRERSATPRRRAELCSVLCRERDDDGDEEDDAAEQSCSRAETKRAHCTHRWAEGDSSSQPPPPSTEDEAREELGVGGSQYLLAEASAAQAYRRGERALSPHLSSAMEWTPKSQLKTAAQAAREGRSDSLGGVEWTHTTHMPMLLHQHHQFYNTTALLPPPFSPTDFLLCGCRQPLIRP
jgi:hypothetical protein